MIGRLRGQLAEKNPAYVLLDVQGVGYEVFIPLSTYCNLGDVGQPCTLLTHLTVREDAHLLYGFETESERQTFKTLIKVSGIGPKMGLAVLSSISPQELAQAIANQDTSRLTKIPGIGKKTAERLLLELKGQFEQAEAINTPQGTINSPQTSHHEIHQALIALGYSDKEAQTACKTLPNDCDVSPGIRFALQRLSKA